jgi:hypothetical protein
MSAFGYVLGATVFCAACSGLPILAGLFGGLGVGARFGLSAGIVSAVVITYALPRRRRARRAPACSTPRLGTGAVSVARDTADRGVPRAPEPSRTG